MPYFMVGVSVSVEAVYPIAAEDERRARAKAEELVASHAVDSPDCMDGSARRGPSAVSCVPSEAEVCIRRAIETFGSEQADVLVGRNEGAAGSLPTPPSMARSAKSVLERSGSGELRPSARRRG